MTVKNKIFIKQLFSIFCGLLVWVSASIPLVHAKSYMTRDEFLQQVIETLPSQQKKSSQHSSKFQSKTLWLTGQLSKQVKLILGHAYPKLRIRYQINDDPKYQTSVWYLEEIGKERPISFAVSIRDNRIQLIQVLEFRESRGQEIHIPAFAKQFDHLRLNDRNRLNKLIDGITGATLSVNAMKKIARLALLFDRTIHQKDHKQ